MQDDAQDDVQEGAQDDLQEGAQDDVHEGAQDDVQENPQENAQRTHRMTYRMTERCESINYAYGEMTLSQEIMMLTILDYIHIYFKTIGLYLSLFKSFWNTSYISLTTVYGIIM